MIERISILGGSSVYIPEFILSLISHNVNVKEVVLIGREGPKLPLVTAFCQRIMDNSGFPGKVTGTVDVREGVQGAKYVINHVRIGGMPARQRDEELPPKFGMVGDETVGAGGCANALRTLPVVLQHAELIEQTNPGATLINLTNPTGIIVDALSKYSRLQVLGVCDLPGQCIRRVADILRVSPEELQVDYVGLNHIGWIQDVKLDGKSRMDRVLEQLEHHSEDGFDHDLVGLFRMIPTSTVGLFFHVDAILKRQQACARTRAEVLYEAEQQILKLYDDETLTEIPELTRARNAIWYEKTIVPLLQALEERHEREIILCVKNEGAVRDLPEDCSVEVPVRISKKGIEPRRVGDCPRFLKGLFHSVKESDRLTVEAARHKSYECALQALTINPLVPSLDAARAFLDRILKEEGIELH
ncbi:MAG TPA: hypothetical protein PLM14_15495 [Candidatus Hydrogenedentes bacterium]|nr:hypothetical protein [Candidatus Hydrogenedentota bacterium]HQE84404.1 hypothetical protein [Candidatus Hydrogenedentota bacterium]HQH52295.1 hypothetical protein [Candidatus Hydrogenedentota bacterium]HQM51450.1 hypothetical protein [Candidatus Hydrogenedentota bacterium]